MTLLVLLNSAWLQTPAADAFGWALFHSLWQGAIAATLLATILAITRSARARYVAACLAMFATAVCFAVTLLRTVPLHPGHGIGVNPAALRWNNLVDLADSSQTPMHRLADILPSLVPFWMLGVVVFYLRHVAGWVVTLRLRRRGVCCAPDFWQERLRLLAGRLQLSRSVQLLESGLAQVPVVIGHLRPVILMPVGLCAGLPASQIESILLHELAHVRRYDYLVNVLQRSVEGLLFYHPLVWWISGVIRREREHCADDLAVGLAGGAREYACALAALEQYRWDASETAALAATGGNIVNRVRRQLIPSESASSALTPLACAGFLIVTGALGLTAWQAKAPDSPAAVPQRFYAQRSTGQAEANPAEAPAQPAAKAPPYTRWVQEDAAYIITDEERKAFQRLESDEERNQFIDQFWLRRDPTPNTPENEFRDEHYRRIAQANLRFPTATGTAGWKTDRGRIYIVYGPPDEIDDHSAIDKPTAVPFIDWTYRYLEGIGTNVKIEFADPTGTHEFRMTSDPDPPAK